MKKTIIKNNGTSNVKDDLFVTSEVKNQLTTAELARMVQDMAIKDGDGEVNLTPIARMFKKRIDTWKKSNAEIIDHIRFTSGAETDILRAKKGFDGGQGTFTNSPDLFLEFLRYCSPAVAVKMTQIVRELFQNGKVEITSPKIDSLTPALPSDFISALEALLVAEKQKAELTQTLEHKNKIVLEYVAKVPAKTMRTTINEIVIAYAHEQGMQYNFVWNKLYKEFKALYHIDLKVRSQNDHRLSTIEFAEKLGQLENLYFLSLKMFEI
jgi:hypothetical protein